MRRTTLSVAVLLFAAAVARAEILDRVLAVVAGQIITLSDVNAALRLGLVPPDVSTDPVDAALQRLIDRRLMLTEVERYAPPEPSEAEVDAAVANLRAMFKDALAFEIALNRTAMSNDELRRFMRDSLRIESYLQQRITGAVQPTDDDLEKYYRAHQDEFSVNGVLRPFDQVRDEVRARVEQERREAFAREWVAGLRRRASIAILYLPARR
jgi:hypothetical protein